MDYARSGNAHDSGLPHPAVDRHVHHLVFDFVIVRKDGLELIEFTEFGEDHDEFGLGHEVAIGEEGEDPGDGTSRSGVDRLGVATVTLLELQSDIQRLLDLCDQG